MKIISSLIKILFYLLSDLHMTSSETDGCFQIYIFFSSPMTNTSFVPRNTIDLFLFLLVYSLRVLAAKA